MMIEVIKKVEKYEYVSFDMFDTLIKRNVQNPKDVFTIMQMHYENKNIEIYENFRRQRVDAEQRSRELSIKEEITLDEIYEQFSDIYSEDIIAELKELEILTELNVCVTNPDMIDVYNYCVEKGKRILIVSDMYLPLNVLIKILQKNGFDTYEKLYVSSEIGVQKSSGNLFKYVLNDSKITKKHVIHIGDNKKSDFLKPRYLGIKSVLIPNHINHLRYYSEENLNSVDLFTYKSIALSINNCIISHKSEFWMIGYETLGPLLYGFSEWLLAGLKAKGIKKVFFFSRDGYIMQKAFDLINDTNIVTEYFYASRRALIVPLIWAHPELKDVVASMFIGKRISVENFIKKLGLNANKYIKQMDKYGLELTTILNGNSLPDNDIFSNFYKEIKNDVVDNSKYEYTLLIEYLEQIGFDGNVAIVDIGWFGNMQRSLCELIEIEKKDTKIVGFYTGVLSNPNKIESDKREMYGYLFQNEINKELYLRKTCFTSIFETLFLGQHGSVEKFKKTESGIIPVLYPYEFLEFDGSHSKEVEIVTEIQCGALDFVNNFSNSKVYKGLVISPFCAFQNMQRLGTAPNKYDSRLFGDIRFYDTDVRYIAKPRKLGYYFFHPKNLVSDFLNAPWRIGFMQRLLKVPLRYYKIYMLMRKFLTVKV